MTEKPIGIIATIGPATNNSEMIRSMVRAGASIFRLYFGHGSHEGHLRSIQLIRGIDLELGIRSTIFMDLQGPKIRIGEMENPVEILPGEFLTITTKDIRGTSRRVPTTMRELTHNVQVGETILIDDGKIELLIKNVSDHEIETQVIHGGSLRSRSGISLPNSNLKIPSLTDKDLHDVKLGIQNDLDWISVPFTRSINNIEELKSLIGEKNIKTVARLETKDSIQNINQILTNSDIILFARGNLSVISEMEEIPFIQKKIFRKCNEYNKPIICANQILESLIENPKQTRMETNDIVNSILDGANFMLLSAETAAGKYPIEAIKNMRRIILNTSVYSHEQGVKARIKLPEEIRILVMQYLNFFNEYIRIAKKETVELNVVFYDEGLELTFTDFSSDAWMASFEEYISFIKENIEDIHVNFTREATMEGNKILTIALRNEVQQLKFRLELKDFEIKYLQEKVLPVFERTILNLSQKSNVITVTQNVQTNVFQLKNDIDKLKLDALDTEKYIKNLVSSELSKEFDSYIELLNKVHSDQNAKNKLPSLLKHIKNIDSYFKSMSNVAGNIGKISKFIKSSWHIISEMAAKLDINIPGL